MMATKTDRPRVLIEQWLPIAEIGAECMRERGASSALPPLYFLHVWWARRPLTVSRAAILASLLPAYPIGDDGRQRPWPVRFGGLKSQSQRAKTRQKQAVPVRIGARHSFSTMCVS
jgi:hypothetical protein